MKKNILYIIIALLQISCYSQKFTVKIEGTNQNETTIIDSLKYSKNHTDLNSLNKEINKTVKKLSKNGYLENKITDHLKENDSTYKVTITIGIKIKEAIILTNLKQFPSNLTNTKKDSIKIPYSQIDTTIQSILDELENKGFPLSKIKLINTTIKENKLYSQLFLYKTNSRTINKIEIKTDSENKNWFPKNYTYQINKRYKNKIPNRKTVNEIKKEFDNLNFSKQIKHPEILFLKDTSKIYVYLQKNNPNTFDGFIGLNNNDQKKTKLNGYLDLKLENIIQSGEQLSLFWKNNGNNQSTFNTKLELPYIFKTRAAIKSEINIFKQDSTFQNTKTEFNIGYLININSKIYIGYTKTSSTDILSNNINIKDYQSTFVNLDYTFTKNKTPNKLAKLSIKTGIGSRATNNDIAQLTKTKQYYIEIESEYIFKINNKNNINLRNQTYYLSSVDYIDNELYRFGGINSIRGFDENSIFASKYSNILSEYTYIVNKNLKTHLISDYSILKNNEIKNLFTVGTGISINNKDYCLKILFSNGNEKINNINLNNSILTINWNIIF